MRFMMIALVLMMGMTTNAQAQADSKASGDSDKLDIKKLEDKYWSAKDDDFSVVQNRSFTKEHRYFVTLQSGIPINDPYSYGNVSGVSAGYYFSERWGVEVSSLSTSFRDNDATDQFITDHKTVPNHNTLNGMTGVQVNYVPLYAKMSFLDKKIIYFDMGIAFGIGQTKFTQNISTGDQSQTASNYMFSLYQHFFFSENLAFKFDFRNTWTNEERMRYKLNPGEPESARTIGAKSINDTALLFGITYFIGGGQK